MHTEERKKFYVVAVISNQVRYLSRYRLFRKFQNEMEQAGVQLIVVETAFGDRPHEITSATNPYHLQLRTFHEVWHKENMINLGVQHLSRLDPNWKYFAFIDADVSFVRPDWVDETIHQLQHHHIVQMFQNAIDLGPNGESFAKYDGFAWAFNQGKFDITSQKYTSFHPGYCWAMTHEAYEMVGGLIDTAVLGAGDRHMAFGMAGCMEKSITKGLHESYAQPMYEWEKRAERYIQRDVGFVGGTILHHWHGKKKDRKYHSRWNILINNNFNLNTDVKRDRQGLLQLEVMDVRQMKLRDDIRHYFRSRNEDSIDLD